MNHNQRLALAERDLMVKDLGHKLNKHCAYVTGVLSGRFKPPKLRRQIAEILEKPESFLWPEEEK